MYREQRQEKPNKNQDGTKSYDDNADNIFIIHAGTITAFAP